MGTSFVEYRSFGFWSRDSFLESWLGTLLGEMREGPRGEAWQDSLIEKWTVQSTIDGGVMCLGLDELLVEEKRLNYVLTNARNALGRSDSLGRRTGELSIELLEGKLKTTESSPVDYFDD